MSKVLVSYFSASGVTANVAKELCKVVNGDLHEIAPAEVYTKEDLDYTNKESRVSVEMNNPTSRPQLADTDFSAADYDVIYVGYPIWWGVAPHVVNAFLEGLDLSGKKVIAFATSGGSDMKLMKDALTPSVAGAELIVGCVVKGSEEIEGLAKLA